MSHLAHQITLEQGFADVYGGGGEHYQPKVHAPVPLPRWLVKWENHRPRWLMELIAETTGVFIYTYCGTGATASFMVSTVAKQAGYGDLLTIGFSYGLGIIFALLVAAPTSGGHLSPAYTIAFAIFKGFPWKKVPQYIVAQILGSFLACYMVYLQYKQPLSAYAEELKLLGPLGNDVLFSSSGPAGALAFFASPGQNLGYVFINEFAVTTLLSIFVWSILDGSNFFISFTTAPILLGAAYMVMIWAFAEQTTVLNTARDLGGRLAAAAIFGTGAFTHNPRYTALAALTNIVGTSLGALFQTLFLMDSQRPIVNPAPEGSAEGMELKRKVTQGELDGSLRKRPTVQSIDGSGREKI